MEQIIRDKNIKSLNESICQLNKMIDYNTKNLTFCNNYITKTLDQLCKLMPESDKTEKYGDVKGKYPFYTSSVNCTKYCNTFEYNTESLILGDNDYPNINYDIKFSVSNDCYVLQKDDNSINLKYLYYYILCILNNIDHKVNSNYLSKDYILYIQIPIIPLEDQEKYIVYCEDIQKQIEQYKQDIEKYKNLI